MPMPSELAKNYLAAHLKVAFGIVPIGAQNIEGFPFCPFVFI